MLSVKGEQPKDEQTVEVWLMYDHQTLHIALVCKLDVVMGGRTDKLTDGRSDAPSRLSRPGESKTLMSFYFVG